MERFRYCKTPFAADGPLAPEWALPPDDVQAFHRSLPGYQPTPLLELPALARESCGDIRELLAERGRRCGLAMRA